MDHYKAKGAEYEEAIVELSDLRQVTEMACRYITYKKMCVDLPSVYVRCTPCDTRGSNFF